MYNFIGFILAGAFVYIALDILKVDSSVYLDEVALVVVFGGTLAALMIAFPPIYIVRFFTAPWQILRARSPKVKKGIEVLVKLAHDNQNRRQTMNKYLNDKNLDPFLKEGIDLYLLDLSKDDFKNIMTERIYRNCQRDEQWINLFRRLAKYPPAFGLVGTVLGLISLMRAVGEGANTAQIGLNMALALTATLYGLGLANFVLAPIAENFQHKSEETKVYQELLLEGLLMIYDQNSSLSVQEMLNSYLPPTQRVDILGVHQKAAA